MQSQGEKGERSLGDLFGDLARETSELIRQEVTLAKTELSDKATKVGKDLGFLAAGGAVAYAGFLALVAAVIYFLAEVVNLPLWISALVVGIVVAAVGYFLIRKGLDALKRVDPVPQETVQSLQEDAAWVKGQVQ